MFHHPESRPTLPGLKVCCPPRGFLKHRTTCGLHYTSISCGRLGCRNHVVEDTAFEAYKAWNDLMDIKQPWTEAPWFKEWLRLAGI